MARDIPVTEALLKGLSVVLDAVGNGAPLASGAFARAPLSIAVRASDPVRQAARQVGIQVTRTGFAFTIWQESDCDVVIAKLADLKLVLAKSKNKARLAAPGVMTSSARARDLPLTKELFTRLLAILAIIEAGHPAAASAYLRGPVSIAIRTPEVARYLAGQLGIPVTRSGIAFEVWNPAGCEVALIQLIKLQERMVAFGALRADVLPLANKATGTDTTSPAPSPGK